MITWLRTDDAHRLALPDEFWEAPDGVLAAHGRTLKSSAYHRTTHALPCAAGQTALVKRIELCTLAERLKWRLKRSAPQTEWHLLAMLKNAGCPVPAPVALGCERSGPSVRVWLVTEFINDAVTFDQMRPVCGAGEARAAARSLARTVAAMHAAGVWHGDLHSGNLLYVREACAWFVTDLQRAHLGRPGRHRLVGDLVQLQHCLGKKVRLGVRLAFLKAYLDAYAQLTGTQDELTGGEWKSLFDDIRARSRAYAIGQARRRAGRCEQDNRDFAGLAAWIGRHAVPHGFINGWVVRTLSRQLLGDLLTLLADENWFLSGDVTLLKNTRSVAVGVWRHPQGTLFIKQYMFRNTLHDKILRAFKRSKAYRAWRRAWRLIHLHVPTPRPVMVVWTPRGGILVSEYLDGAITSEAALRRLPGAARQNERRALIRTVAAELAHLHDCAAEHGDLKASNALVTGYAPGRFGVFFTDIDAARFYTRIPWSRRVRDLARLHAALFPFAADADRRYFLRVYLSGISEALPVKALIAAIGDRAANKIMTKHGTRVRPG
ncbi:hypothetical protein GX586_04480 [bacterium]|nr:hypothetical protein [bacterium]